MNLKDKLEMIDKVYKINKAIESNQISELIVIPGLTDELIDGLTLEEIIEVTNVRLYDFTKKFEELYGGAK